MAAGTHPAISRSLLRRELSELESYMERALFFFHVAPALVRNPEEERKRLDLHRAPDRFVPAVDRRAQTESADRGSFRLRSARSWLPAFF
jgi:hypothetical protein